MGLFRYRTTLIPSSLWRDQLLFPDTGQRAPGLGRSKFLGLPGLGIMAKLAYRKAMAADA